MSHNVSLFSLKVLQNLGFKLLTKKRNLELLEVDFENRLGLAAGLDKNGDYIDTLAALGFGFLEIGTITPLPQPGNKKPRLFRIKKDKSLINQMGFNNKGVDHLVNKLIKRKSKIPLGISIGKNFFTKNDQAHEDYLNCLERVYEYSAYVAVNVSSPNTRGLRELQFDKPLDLLLSVLKRKQMELSELHGYKPLFLKISPDNSHDQLVNLLDAIIDHNIDGLICSNTSVNHNFNNGKGGLSGSLIFDQSTELLRFSRKYLGTNFPIIASGGVMSKKDFEEKIKAGADLVQIYTGFVYEGPLLIDQILN